MEKNNYKNTLRAAIAITFSMAMLLLINLRKPNEDLDGIQVVFMVSMIACAIFLWLKCAKQYIDFAIDEKLKKNLN